jgi:hypothetical protein
MDEKCEADIACVAYLKCCFGCAFLVESGTVETFAAYVE